MRYTGNRAQSALTSLGDALEVRVVLRLVEHVGDEVRELLRLGLRKPRVVIAGEPMRTPLVTIGFCGSFGIAFLLTVMCARPSAASASLPVMFFGAQVDQEHVAVGAARDDAQAALGEHRGHGARVVQHLLLVGLELGLERLAERHRLGGDDVHQRPALQAREDRAVDGFFELASSRKSCRRAARAASCASWW